MTTNGDRHWEGLRRRILFFAGLVGFFLYFLISQLTGDFQIEWLLAFLTLMGVSIAQGLDKR